MREIQQIPYIFLASAAFSFGILEIVSAAIKEDRDKSKGLREYVFGFLLIFGASLFWKAM